MESTLIYNSNAGGLNGLTPDDLKEALLDGGYHPVYKATGCEEELDTALAEVEGLVVVAGGDGTLRAVASRVIGKKDVALSVLPMGTANNIAKTLEIKGSPLEIIANLSDPNPTKFDVGYVRAPWGEDYFFEGCGCGFYADALATYDPEKGKDVLRSAKAIVETLKDYQSYSWQMLLDGQKLNGEYLLLEVLNTTAVGPRLELAPEASPEDGLFDVVRFYEGDRDGVLSYVSHMVLEKLDDLPSVEVVRGKKLEIEWTGFPFHVDGEVRPVRATRPSGRSPAAGARPSRHQASEGKVTIEIMPRALEFWLPSSSESKNG